MRAELEMKEHSLLGQNFWSGVINYVKAVAQKEETLKSADFEVNQEAKTVLVFKTSVAGIVEQLMITKALNELLGNNNWTIDLDDVDKVLRVVCLANLQPKVVEILNQFGFKCEMLM